MKDQIAIWWVRRDLRLADNPALTAALSSAEQIIPLFILDQKLLSSRYAGDKRTAFLFAGLQDLQNEIAQRGGRLMLRSGEPLEVIRQVLRESSAHQIFAERDISPYARNRDQQLVDAVPLTLVDQPGVADPDEVLKQSGEPYSVFTPYARQWKHVVSDAPARVPAPTHLATPEIDSLLIPETPELPDSVPFIAGHRTGTARLEAFTNGDDPGIYRYGAERDRLDLDATSRLSPYLRFGMISARDAVAAAMGAIKRANNDEARASAETWLNELIWREFYIAILYHFPHVRTNEFKEQYRNLHWINGEEDIDAWTSARTGYPVIDACMRQLHAEGWMHNRGRMITSSFLIKHLLVDWRLGELHFMQHLIDGDPASNNGGWQWTAGTGTDAAPYFRVFNPTLQSKRHDPHGTFIRRWIPELADVPDRFIHEPWTMPESEQDAAECLIGRDYPEPIIDHTFARQRALDAIKRN